MAGAFDADIQAAQELIALYGEACKWQKPAPIVEDEPGYPTTGAKPEPVNCRIAFFAPRDLGRGTEEFLALLRGTEVPVNKEVGLLAGGISFSPELPDTLIRASGEEIAIERIDRLAPNGTPVLYYVTVRA